MMCSSAKYVPAMESLCPDQRILVVENDKGNAFVIGTILDLLGYDHDMVESGEEAVKAVKRNEYTVILMDVMLNGMCGIQTTKRIRASEISKGLTPVPIIAVSAQTCSEIKDNCLKAGMNDYLCKPYRIEVISERLASQRAVSVRYRTQNPPELTIL